jgi:sensor histidine kinase
MKFRLKITLSMLCLLAVLFSVGGSALISISFQNAMNQEMAAARDRHQMLLSVLTAAGNSGVQQDAHTVSHVLRRFSASGAPAWSAVRLSSDTDALYQDGDASSELNQFTEQIDTQHSLISYFTDAEGTPYLQFSCAFTSDGDILYLDTAYDLSNVYESRDRQQSTYQTILLGMLAVCALASYSISWMLTRPLNRLSRASRQIASGNLSYRSRLRTRDEIGALSADFDSMAKQIEKNVSDLNAAMERQEQFMSSFAHELKTPMTSIIGYADLLRAGNLTKAEQVEAAGYIFSEGKRLESLSLKLLDIFVSGRRELDPSPVSPLHAAQELADRLRPVYKWAGVDIRCGGEDGICLLNVDLLRSLLVNLAENARKAMPKGGIIEIYVTLLPDGCKICVTDNGSGIPEEALAHLTEAFYRVDKARSRAQGGAGLGLTLCAKIVELHGGTLRFASKLGVGTRVTAELRGGRP